MSFIAPEVVRLFSFILVVIPVIVAAIARLDPCPDDELIDKTRPWLIVMGIAGVIGLLWSWSQSVP